MTLDEPDPVLGQDWVETCEHTGTGYMKIAYSITLITLVEYIVDEAQFDSINFIQANGQIQQENYLGTVDPLCFQEYAGCGVDIGHDGCMDLGGGGVRTPFLTTLPYSPPSDVGSIKCSTLLI